MIFSQAITQKDVKSQFFFAIGGALFLTLISKLAFNFPFNPVPMVFTPQAIILMSILMGRTGTYATLTYLVMGLSGLPVFTGGGGALYFIAPTGGYLVGFAVGSIAVTLLSERMKEKNSLKVFGLLLLGSSLVYLCGLPHLATFVGWKGVFALGLYPFAAACILKICIAERAWRLFEKKARS